MIVQDLLQVQRENSGEPPEFIRSLQKEALQFYILDCISKGEWSGKLIFKGGTALRIFFELPRLSEDLDFDFKEESNFHIENFAARVSDYFIKSWQFKDFNLKIANNKRTLYIKLPGFSLFVRVDFSYPTAKTFVSEISVKSTSHFSFVICHYSLTDLFAGKIAAILKRETTEGVLRTARYKGRDFFDLIWFLEKNVKPNWQFVEEATGLVKDIALKNLKKKVESLDKKFLLNDLKPFTKDWRFINQLAENYQQIFNKYQKNL